MYKHWCTIASRRKTYTVAIHLTTLATKQLHALSVFSAPTETTTSLALPMRVYQIAIVKVRPRDVALEVRLRASPHVHVDCIYWDCHRRTMDKTCL